MKMKLITDGYPMVNNRSPDPFIDRVISMIIPHKNND
jgi:hypothetical protein